MQTQALQERKQVEQTLSAQNVMIHKDKHGSGQQSYGEQETEDEDFYGPPEEDYTLPPTNIRGAIDIKI